jgi:uncharacterized protein YjbI with pentapeptide repeats
MMEKPTRASIEQRVRKGEDLSRMDLRQVNLSGAKLAGAKLGRADLEGANLENVDLSGADLSGASLREAFMAGANLEGALLKKTDLDGAVLRMARLKKADLSRANLEGTNLEGADLEKAKFKYAQLDSANLTTAILTGANFSQADLDSACLAGVQAERANFSRASLANASLDDAQFKDAIMDESVLRAASLRRTNFQGASLVEADLEKSVCDAADFSRADLRRARFPLAVFRQTTIDSARVFGIELGPQSHAESFIAQRLDLSREADGSRWVNLARFLKNPSGAEDASEQRLRRYVGPGDILRNAELSFESGAEVHVDGLLEHCELNMAADASLIIGETGVLENCRVVGGRVRVNGCFLERSRVGLDGPVELVVSRQGAVATTLQQPASETQFGFAAGCRLRLYIKNPKKAAEDNHAAATN